MKILVIHNRYQQAGGENVAVDTQVGLLKDRDNEVILYQRDNHEIEKFSLLKRIHFFFSSIYSFRTTRELREAVRANRPDIAHVHNVFPLISPSVYWILKKERIPYIQTIHNFRFMCPNGLFFRNGQICELCKMGHYGNAIRWKCYRNSFSLSLLYSLTIWLHRRLGTFDFASAFIVLNPFTKQKLVEAHITKEDKIHLIQNSIKPPEKVGERNYDAGIVYLGRLSIEKGVEDLLACLKLIPNIKVTIAGSGPDESSLNEIARMYPERVCFTGFITGEEKDRLIRHSLVVVQPSKCYEQLPVVALEAMAAGKPLIVPDMAGWNSLVKNEENGLLFQPGDVADLAAKIQRFIDDPELASSMGENAKRDYEMKYSAEIHYRKLMGLYQEILNAKSK